MQRDKNMTQLNDVWEQEKKYSDIIKPLLNDIPEKSGRGMRLLQVNDKKIEFVRLQDANKLVDRLRILFSSKSAGHTP